MTGGNKTMIGATIFGLIILLFIIAFWTLVIYLAILLIKTLRAKNKNIAPPTGSSSLGENLKALRTKNNMTQEMLAERLGVSRQAVSKWENGESEPSTANLLALAKLYGISVDELLRGCG